MAGSGHNLTIGRLGERLAAEFLIKNGCQILDKNFRTRFGEIDLIARWRDEVLFCEVKSRLSLGYGYPEQAVDDRKISHLLAAAKLYRKLKGQPGFWRVDIISVELDQERRRAKITWFKNAAIDR